MSGEQILFVGESSTGQNSDYWTMSSGQQREIVISEQG
jgi:hypothetical protein